MRRRSVDYATYCTYAAVAFGGGDKRHNLSAALILPGLVLAYRAASDQEVLDWQPTMWWTAIITIVFAVVVYWAAHRWTWRPGDRAEHGDVTVRGGFYTRAAEGRTVCVYLFAGALGARWFVTDDCPRE